MSKKPAEGASDAPDVSGVEIWADCWNCGHETPQKRRSLAYFPRVIEVFVKGPGGGVKDRAWQVLTAVFQFTLCRKCGAPALVVDEYWVARDDSVQAILQFKEAIDRTGHDDRVERASRHLYPAFSHESFPKWTQDLEESVMLLFWEVYTAITMKLPALALMGIRAIVDDFATRSVGDIGGFEKKLKALLDTGIINTVQHSHLSAVVEAGNAASHRGHRPSLSHVSLCMEIVESLLARERFGASVEELRKATPPRPRDTGGNDPVN